MTTLPATMKGIAAHAFSLHAFKPVQLDVPRPRRGEILIRVSAASLNYRVNAVAPGLIDTDLLVGKIDDAGKQRVADSAPLGRLGTPLDIADAFVYLCSDMSRFVTGVVLDVNGGLHIH